MKELLGMMEMFCILIVIAVTQLYILVKAHEIVYFKRVSFIIYKSYLGNSKISFRILPLGKTG